MYISLFIILGLCIGSFSNVVIYRLPDMILREGTGRQINLCFPRSYCPECQHSLRVLELVPLLSWLFLRGRCSVCRCKISTMYPAVELINALMYGLIAYFFPEPLTALPICFLINALIIMMIIDYRHLLLPDLITLPLIWAGLLWNSSHYGIVELNQAVYGAVVGYLSLWITYWLYLVIRKREGLGFGDFKLSAALGAWLGIDSINFIMLIAPVIGIFTWYVRRPINHEKMIPFGPALCSSGILYLIYLRSGGGYLDVLNNVF